MNIRAKQSLYTFRIRFWIKTVLPPVDEATTIERKGSFGTCFRLLELVTSYVLLELQA